MLRSLYKYLFILFMGLMALPADAQHWSYVYIQGDKETPFYVKLEDEMLPRFSKHYYIIPELEAGPIRIQILFQQNEYPALNFKILVPEAGYRGFLLTRKGSNFALYDIPQKFYLLPGDEGEDHLPEIIPITASTKKYTAAPETKPEPKKTTTPKKTVPVKQEEDDEPKFLENIELVNEHSVQDTPEPIPAVEVREEAPVNRQEVSEETTGTRKVFKEDPPAQPVPEPAIEEDYRQTEAQVNLMDNSAPIINSDCPEPMGDVDFDKIYNSTHDKQTDKKRIEYLMDKVKGKCYSTRQVYFLARQLQAESMRYSFLKKVYPRITDQQNFPLLEESLFKTLEWKSYFRLIQ